VIVLHLFVPGGPKKVRQSATWSRLELLRRHGRHVVVDWPTNDDHDNAAALNFFWNRGESLCVLEQDVEPTLEQLVDLERCTQADVCNLATRCGGHGVVDAYDFRIRDQGGVRWGREGELVADLFPLGCTIFRPAAMQRLSRVPDVGWSELDTVLATQLGTRAHVHWPAAEHHHG